MTFRTLTSADWTRSISSARSQPNVAWLQIRAKLSSSVQQSKPQRVTSEQHALAGEENNFHPVVCAGPSQSRTAPYGVQQEASAMEHQDWSESGATSNQIPLRRGGNNFGRNSGARHNGDKSEFAHSSSNSARLTID